MKNEIKELLAVSWKVIVSTLFIIGLVAAVVFVIGGVLVG